MNVLILTDFSEVSDNAGKYAVDFLQDFTTTFYLLNIQDFNFNRSESDKLENQLLSTWENLQAGIKKLEDYTYNPKHTFNYILSSDNLINAVRKALEEKKIDLIFIGAASQHIHHHPILGDHAYDVIRKIRCNIMAVPGDSKYVKLERLVLPVDYSVLTGDRVFQLLESKAYLNPDGVTKIEVDEKSAGKKGKKFALKAPVKVDGEPQLHYVKMEKAEIFSEDLLKEIQNKFDMIVVLGKNLSVCDRLLHAKYGLFTTVDNSLPILVIHE